METPPVFKSGYDWKSRLCDALQQILIAIEENGKEGDEEIASTDGKF